jgi:hypothetical protein
MTGGLPEFVGQQLLEQAHARITRTLMDGIRFNVSTNEARKFLKRKVNTKINLVTMFVDISDSTRMSLSLPQDKFALVIQTFIQEISIIVLG